MVAGFRVVGFTPAANGEAFSSILRNSVAPTAGPSPEVIVTGVMIFKNFDANDNLPVSVPSWPDLAGGFDVKVLNGERQYNLIHSSLNQ